MCFNVACHSLWRLIYEDVCEWSVGEISEPRVVKLRKQKIYNCYSLSIIGRRTASKRIRRQFLKAGDELGGGGECLAVVFRVLEVLGSNLGPNNAYSYQGFSWFPSVHPQKCFIVP
jgi:hypothetical protein